MRTPGAGDDPKQSNPVVVGLDVGGTKTLAVAVDPRPGAAVAALASVRSEQVPDVEALCTTIESLTTIGSSVEPTAERSTDARPDIRGIGVGLAAWIDRSGVARRSPHVPSLLGVDLTAALESRFGVPTSVHNDANCAARAAAHVYGATSSCLLTVTFGTGIGAGLVIDGELVRGAHGFAGEPGHVVMDPTGAPCPCGQRGCWERYASGPGIAAMAAESIAAGVMQADSVGGPHPAPERVVAAATAGHPGAEEVMGRFAWWVARGLVAVANVIDPDLICVGGGLSTSAGIWLPRVRELVAADPSVGDRGIRIEVVPGADTAGAVGAALMAADSLAGVTPDPASP